jgi:2-polyprenyl-3-methyl-5-hydroxy-6-metoxy-1,4-benzoquinol methylase
MSSGPDEMQMDERFKFGDNWMQFLSLLTEERINEAKSSLQCMLEVDSLDGMTFVDVGSGSGLFSLAARSLGASVYSFDYDRQSVACTQELKRRYFELDARWVIEEGSVLDEKFLGRLGQYDVVYSWGVLHHTGRMWKALENVTYLVKPKGTVFIAIYNKQPILTRYWVFVKRLYCWLPKFGKSVLIYIFFLFFMAVHFFADILRMRNPLLRYLGVKIRGMSPYYDTVDWIGGWPFEVATPKEISDFFGVREYTLKKLVSCGGKHGCNEFVFTAPRKLS